MLKKFKTFITEAVKILRDFLESHVNPHLGRDKYDVHHNLHAMQGSDKGMSPSLNGHEAQALKNYTTDSSGINEGLMNKDGIAHEAQTYAHKYATFTHEVPEIEHLDSALSKHTLPKMTVHAGIGFDPSKIADKDGHFMSHAYTSTTINPSDSIFFARPQTHDGENFHRHILNIHVPHGHNGLYLGNKDAGSLMTHTSEHEVLLPRGLTFKVGKKPKYSIQSNEHGPDTFHVWDAHIVPKEKAGV